MQKTPFCSPLQEFCPLEKFASPQKFFPPRKIYADAYDHKTSFFKLRSSLAKLKLYAFIRFCNFSQKLLSGEWVIQIQCSI